MWHTNKLLGNNDCDSDRFLLMDISHRHTSGLLSSVQEAEKPFELKVDKTVEWNNYCHLKAVFMIKPCCCTIKEGPMLGQLGNC